MTTIDRFESLFRSAVKERHEYEKIALEKAVLVTDTDAESSKSIQEQIQASFSALEGTRWSCLEDGSYEDVTELVVRIGESGPDLVCTYRNLYAQSKQWPYSLGEHVDVLAQITPMPLLVVPHPSQGGVFDPPLSKIERVLVLTDHMVGCGDLVNYGARVTPAGGTLVLAHVEDDATFARYADVLSKIPAIDTESSVSMVREKLLGEAREYIESTRESLANAESPIATIVSEVRMGHRISDVRELIEAHEIDLVVFHVKDDEQLAMHGLSYPLAVELRDIPVLMV